MKNLGILILIVGFFYSCAVVRPGEVGIKQTLGKLSKETKTQGKEARNQETKKRKKERTKETKKESKKDKRKKGRKKER